MTVRLLLGQAIPFCNDNGTPDNLADDTYTFSLTVTGVNSGNNGWQALVNGQPVTGTYGNAVTLGAFAIGSNVTITGIRDVVKGCTPAAIAIPSPAPCFEVCDLTATFAYGDCNDNGTTNTGDDTFSFIVTVTGGSGNWTASDGTTGTYGQAVIFPAYPANGATIALTITDDDNPDCSTQLSIIAPNNCDDDCNVTATLREVLCNPDQLRASNEPLLRLKSTLQYTANARICK